MIKKLSVREVFLDSCFYKNMWSIALPITLQNLIISSINMADVFMVGKLGVAEIAGLGLANQINFLLILYLFGVNSGTSVFTAQFYGKKDLRNVHRALGLSLIMSCLGGVFFSILCFFMPQILIAIFSKDSQVIFLGGNYLKIISLSFPINAVAFVYAIQLRNIGKSKLPLYASFLCLFLNVGLNYLLIFGKFGFPRLGVEGAAIGTLITHFFECVALLKMAEKTELSSKLEELLKFDLSFFKRVLSTTIPVIFNEIFWSLGITIHSLVYARLGTDEIASVNIGMSIDRIAFVAFIGLSSATAVMIGHKLGEGNEEEAYSYSVKFSIITVLLAVIIGVLLIALSTPIISLYNIDSRVSNFSKNIIMLIALLLPIRSFNIINIVGILRAGGDTKYCFFLDILCLWLIGVPGSVIGGLYFKLPVYIVFLLASSEEFFKFFIGLRRMLSKKWIKNLVNEIE